MSYTFTLTTVIPATPKQIYDTWLDSRGHSAMTGGKATQSSKLGGKAMAWDGYITGKNLELKSGKRIVQSWRTSEFSKDHADSQVTVTLAAAKTGTRLTLKHSGVPDGQTSYETGGWKTHYFEPMKTYFTNMRMVAGIKAGGRKVKQKMAKKKATRKT